MSLATPPSLEQRLALRDQRWQRYLADMTEYAAVAQPLESVGTLLRVTGLVLEAAGIRVPVGSVCEVHAEGQQPVLAEVVGFSGDRAYLMPTGELHGLSSGARVVPRPAPLVPLQLQVLEADFLDATKSGALSDGRLVQGIEFDPVGKRRAYWLHGAHPGDAGNPVGPCRAAAV
jgi:flagellar biosynthesis/type III secretory pathway ATPase